MSRIVIVSGPPGAGKSTVARRLARQADAPRAMHLHTDDMHGYIQKGGVLPWRPEAITQNIVIMDAIAASAAVCARGGFRVFVDGIVGPWFFDPWRALARAGDLDVRYVALTPTERVAVGRATARMGPGDMTDETVARYMWNALQVMPLDARHTIDNSEQTPEQTVAEIQARLARGEFVLG